MLSNNEYGISTRRDTQWPMQDLIRRAEPFGIPWEVVDGNDFFASWDALSRAMAHCRETRTPYALQANVSRLHGHSSASGATRVQDERDAIVEFESELIDRDLADADILAAVWIEEREQAARDLEIVRQEPMPRPETIYENIYA